MEQPKNLFEVFLDVIQNHYADFEGRASRRYYWYYVAVNFLISLVFTYGVGAISKDMGSILAGIYSLAVLVPGLALSVRRMHDLGKSGWNILWSLIPCVGWALMLYWCCLEGQAGPNQYGPDPKGNSFGKQHFGNRPQQGWQQQRQPQQGWAQQQRQPQQGWPQQPQQPQQGWPQPPQQPQQGWPQQPQQPQQGWPQQPQQGWPQPPQQPQQGWPQQGNPGQPTPPPPPTGWPQ